MKLINWICFGFGLSLCLNACQKKNIPDVDFPTEMRQFITNLSIHAKLTDPNFIVIPQNGALLMSIDEENASVANLDYLAAIDGQGQEDLFFGYDKDDQASDQNFQNEVTPFLDLGKKNDITILVTDYCSSGNNISVSKTKNTDHGYISYAAPERNLTVIPEISILNENENDIYSLADAKNFLYLINPTNYKVKDDFISALDATNYDAFIIDFFDYNGNAITANDVKKLQTKPNGHKRLVISYMSIGEAEDYRYYWKSEWKKRKKQPEWLYGENKNWKGNYKVFYWMADWQNIIFGQTDAYLDKILNTGFDGVYLDIVDAFEYFNEEKK